MHLSTLRSVSDRLSHTWQRALASRQWHKIVRYQASLGTAKALPPYPARAPAGSLRQDNGV